MSAEVQATVTSAGNVAKMVSFGKHLADRAELDRGEIDGQEVSANIAATILGAKTLEEAFGADESSLPSAMDIVDLEQRVLRFDILLSNDDEKSNPLVGGTFFIVHSIRLSDGLPFDWNTSSTGIVAKLYKGEQLGFINGENPAGVECKVVTKGNSNALSLKLLPKRVA